MGKGIPRQYLSLIHIYYDVLVEGNTDNVPVSTTSAKMKNIRNNWDLSAPVSYTHLDVYKRQL